MLISVFAHDVEVIDEFREISLDFHILYPQITGNNFCVIRHFGQH